MFFNDSSRLKIYRHLKRLQRRLIFQKPIFREEPTISAIKEAPFFEANYSMNNALPFNNEMPIRTNEEGLHTQSISGPHMHRIAKRLKITKDAKNMRGSPRQRLL